MSGLPSTMNLFPPPDCNTTPGTSVPCGDDAPPVLLPIRRTARVNVLHVINGEHFSGAERVQDLLALRLPEEGFAADFAALKPGQFGKARRSTTRLTQLPMRGRIDYKVVGQLKNLVRKYDFKILHAHTPRTAPVTAVVARSLNVPWVYHVHSPVSRDSGRSWQNRINGWVETFSIRSAARVIVVSPSLVPYMEDRGVPAARLVCVPNGVPAFKRRRQELTTSGELIIGMVALFRPRKGTEVLLEALANVVSHGHGVRLRIIGGFETADYETRIRQLVSHLGVEAHVEFTGFTTDVTRELAGLDLMVLPSLYGEGLPMVVLEAMAAGVPIIASRVGGNRNRSRASPIGFTRRAGQRQPVGGRVGRIRDRRNQPSKPC